MEKNQAVVVAPRVQSVMSLDGSIEPTKVQGTFFDRSDRVPKKMDGWFLLTDHRDSHGNQISAWVNHDVMCGIKGALVNDKNEHAKPGEVGTLNERAYFSRTSGVWNCEEAVATTEVIPEGISKERWDSWTPAQKAEFVK